MQKPSEEETCRDTSTFAHMQTSDGTEVARGQGTMLAHMQASVGVLLRMRSDKAFAHLRTPAKDVLIARSDAVTAHMPDVMKGRLFQIECPPTCGRSRRVRRISHE